MTSWCSQWEELLPFWSIQASWCQHVPIDSVHCLTHIAAIMKLTSWFLRVIFFEIRFLGPHKFFRFYWNVVNFEHLVNLLKVGFWLTAFPHRDVLAVVHPCCTRGYYLLCHHGTQWPPFLSDTTFPQHVSCRGHYPIGKDGQMKVSPNAIIALVVDRTNVQIWLEGAK